jgi:haloalkane dehalogenase
MNTRIPEIRSPPGLLLISSPSMSPPPRSRSYRAATGRIRYTDIGEGPPVVLLHGNPTSAHLYRDLVSALSPQYRCIAPDHLGFGRSDAPPHASYAPPAHAVRLDGLLRSLDLHDLTLVLHDWGGPIGLSYALRHPERVRRLVLLNTWAWPLSHRPLIRLASALIGTPLGRILVEDGNAFARIVMPLTLGRFSLPLPGWISTYADALDTRTRRRACWRLARGLTQETGWLRALWSHQDRLRVGSVLLCWGMADPAFGLPPLRRWQARFPTAEVHRWPHVGHYVPEEAGARFASRVRSFLDSTVP